MSATKGIALVTLSLALTVLPAFPAFAVQGRAAEGAVCAEPVVSREYTTEAMIYRLTIDLHGCDWWDGSPLSLVAVLSRDDGEAEDFTFSPVACTGELGEDEPDGVFDVVGCEAVATLEHPAVEVAHYAGAVSYVWQDGDHHENFNTTCVSNAGEAVCRDDYAPEVRGPGIHT